MDWAGIIANELFEEEEMSSLAIGFLARMCKWAAGSEGKIAPRNGGPIKGELRPVE